MELVPYYPLRGVNLLTDPLRLGMDEAVRLKNIYPGLNGKLAKRKGPAYYSWVADAQFGFDPQDLIPTNFEATPYVPDGLITTLISNTGIGWCVLAPNGSSAPYSVASWTSNGLRRPAMLTFNDVTIIGLSQVVTDPAFATGSLFVVTRQASTGDLAFTDGAGLLHSPSTAPVAPGGCKFMDSVTGKVYSPSVISRWRQRVVYGGFDAPYENYIIFSDNNQPFIIESTAGPSGNASILYLNNSSRTMFVPGLKGSRITAIIESSASAVTNLVEPQLMVLSEGSAYIMSGDPIQTTETPSAPVPYLWSKIQYECGCVSQNTVARTPAGLLWASWNDVWAMDYGGIPRRVGTKIRPALMNAPAEHRHLWHAAYDQATGSYRLSVGSQEVDAGLSQPVPDQWWLDLRSGLPQQDASWFGPQQYRVACEVNTSGVRGTYMMKAIEHEGKDPILLAPFMVIHPDSPTSLRSLVFAAMDAQTGYDTAKPRYKPSDGTDLDNAYEELDNDIATEILTPRFDLQDIATDKTFEGLEMGVWANDILAVGVETQVDGGRQVDDQFITIPQTGFVLDVDPLDTTRATHEYQSVTVHPDQDSRLTGKTFQLRIYDKPGWPLAEESLARTLVSKKSGVASVAHNVDASDLATPLWYDTLTLFLSVMAASISSALGLSITSSIVSNKARLTNGSGTTFYLVGDAVGFTAEQLRSSRKIAAMAGFLQNPSFTFYYGDFGGGQVNAYASVHRRISTDLEIAAMFIRVSRFRRRPGGKHYEAEVP